MVSKKVYMKRMAAYKIVILTVMVVLFHLPETLEHHHTDLQTDDQINDDDVEKMIQDEIGEFSDDKVNERYTADINEDYDVDEVFRYKPHRLISRRRRRRRRRISCFRKRRSRCQWFLFRNRLLYLCAGTRFTRCI